MHPFNHRRTGQVAQLKSRRVLYPLTPRTKKYYLALPFRGDSQK
jgi:hypothetical protein